MEVSYCNKEFRKCMESNVDFLDIFLWNVFFNGGIYRGEVIRYLYNF